jgi:hypothetical protein
MMNSWSQWCVCPLGTASVMSFAFAFVRVSVWSYVSFIATVSEQPACCKNNLYVMPWFGLSYPEQVCYSSLFLIYCQFVAFAAPWRGSPPYLLHLCTYE